jgi:hypothetical protein
VKVEKLAKYGQMVQNSQPLSPALTMKQRKDYCIPHDELIFGKPCAYQYIDDKAILALVGNVAIETGMYMASTL